MYVAQELILVITVYRLTNPRLLIGTCIQHRFEEKDGSFIWYEGLVVALLLDTRTFEVVYFEEYEKHDIVQCI